MGAADLLSSCGRLLDKLGKNGLEIKILAFIVNLLSTSTNGEQENNLVFVSNEHDQPCNCSVR